MSTESNLYFPRRYIVLVICWTGLFVIHSMRVNVGVVVITILDQMSHMKVANAEAMLDLPKVNWDAVMIGMLHSVFYVGFIITQIPGGIFSRKANSSILYSVSILGSCLLNVFLPLSIKLGSFQFTIIIRFMQGLCEGLVFPSLYRIMYLWFPHQSIHKYGGLIFGGMYAGPIFGFAVDGAIIHFYKWWFIFYFHSIIGVIWFFFWYLLIYENPQNHPSISENELKYITSNNSTDKMGHLPWNQIFRSTAFWAVITCNFVQSWMFILLLTNEPTYLNQFNFSLVENGIYSALPHIIKVAVAGISGYLSEMLINSGRLSKTNTRKLFNTMGFGMFGIMCFLLFTAKSGLTAIIYLCIGVGFKGFTVSGWQINFLDLSPEFAGILAGISMTFGTIGGILSPIIVGIMTHPQILSNWQKSFLVSGSILIFGAIFYLIFGSGVNQNWTNEEETLLLETKEASKE